MSTDEPPERRVPPLERVLLTLHVSRWELLIVSVLLIAVFATRQGGDLPGRTIRVVDVALVAVALGLVMHAAHVGRRARIVHTAIAATSVVLAIVGSVSSSEVIERIAAGISSYVLAVAAFVIFRLVLGERRVTGDTLFGAMAGYLAVGVIFGGVFTVIARGDPAAFEPAQFVADGQSDLYYFSFVTLTGLGYGDISPASDLTRILAPLETIVGAVILAALVGRIVGLLVAQRSEDATEARLEELTRAIERLRSDGADRERS